MFNLKQQLALVLAHPNSKVYTYQVSISTHLCSWR